MQDLEEVLPNESISMSAWGHSVSLACPPAVASSRINGSQDGASIKHINKVNTAATTSMTPETKTTPNVCKEAVRVHTENQLGLYFFSLRLQDEPELFGSITPAFLSN